MAKAKYNTSSTVETSLNFGEGYGEIVEIEAVVHQFQPSKDTGEQSPPATMVRMKIQRTLQDGTHTAEEPIEEFFGCGALEKFHPGRADGPDDDDVEDQGDEVGADGNCIWSDGSSMNRRSKWVRFTMSLEAAGFKPDVLAKSFLPDLLGTRAFFHSIALEKDADRTYKRDPKALVVKTLIKAPYDKKAVAGAAGGKKGAAGTASAAKAGKGTAPAAAVQTNAAPPAVEAGEVDEQVGMIAVQALQKIASKNPGTQLTVAKVAPKLYTILNNGFGEGPVDTGLHKPVMDLFKDQAWLAEACNDNDYAFAGGVITFPAKAA